MKTYIFQILISIFCGALIGLEREQKSKAAGFRTYILMCLGSCLSMILSIEILNQLGSTDPSRIPAGVVGGIGFICGGVILFNNNKISGITTAIDLWCTSMVGMIIGVNLYQLGIISTACLLIISHLFTYFKQLIEAYSNNNRYQISVEFLDQTSLWELKSELNQFGGKIVNSNVDIDKKRFTFIIIIQDNNIKLTEKDLYNKIRKIKNIKNIIII